MPAPTHVGSKALNNTAFGSSTGTITYPDGTAQGDYIIAVINVNNSTAGTVNTPSAWTKLVENVNGGAGFSHLHVVFGRTVSTETAINFTFTSSNTYTWAVSTFRGVTGVSAAAATREASDADITLVNAVTAGSVPSWALSTVSAILRCNGDTTRVETGTTGWTRRANNAYAVGLDTDGWFAGTFTYPLNPGQASGSQLINCPPGKAFSNNVLAGAQLLLAGSNAAPNTPTSLAPSGATGKNAQTLSAVVSDPDGDSVYAQFQTATDSGFTANVATHNGSTVASGSTSSTGSITFAANTTYYLRARGIDSYGAAGAWTATQTFITNRPPGAPGAWTSPTSAEKVNTTDLVEVAAASDPDGQTLTYDFDLSLDNGASYTAKRTKAAGVSFTYDYTNEAATTAAKWRSRAWDGLTYGDYSLSPTFTVEHNQAPHAPTWTAPPASSTINKDLVNRFDWDFSDPDAGDGQSKFDIQYRLGAGAWTAVAQTTTNTYWDAAAGTFAAGDYEIQVRTYDSQGAASPWSASLFFTAASAPTDLTITYPANGGTISTATDVVKWSTPSQTAFEVRKLADNAGVADTANLLYSSGEVTSSTARDHGLSFPVNGRYEHVQVRIQANGLWSAWVSARILVSYSPPAAPTVSYVERPENAAIDVTTDPGTWPTSAGPVSYTGAGNGTMSAPTTTDGVTDSDAWTATATDATTFDVKIGTTSVGTATTGTAFTYDGVSFTITAGATAFAAGDKFSFQTTAIKTASADMFRRKSGDTGEGLLVAAGISPAGAWRDETTAPGQVYEYRATAIGDNGVRQDGVWGAPVSVTVGQFWLKDPTDWAVSAPVRVTNFPEVDRPRDVTVYSLLDREDPVVEYGQARLGRGTFTVLVRTPEAREWLLGLLRAGRTLLLLSPPDTDGGAGEELWFAPLTYPVKRTYAGQSPDRLVPITFVEVARP